MKRLFLLIVFIIIQDVPVKSERANLCIDDIIEKNNHVCQCNQQHCDILMNQELTPDQVLVVSTSMTKKLESKFASKTDPHVRGVNEADNVVEVTVNRARVYQIVKGFGADINGSTAQLFAKMPEWMQDDILMAYYAEHKGIGFKYLRMSIGGSDDETPAWSYVDQMLDGETHPLRWHAIDDIKKRIIERIRDHQIIQNKNFEIIAVPHWPDAWIESDYYDSIFTKYTALIINSMTQNNIHIWAVASTFSPPNGKKSKDWGQKQRKCLLELKKQAKIKIFDICPQDLTDDANPAKSGAASTYPSQAVDGLVIKTIWDASSADHHQAIQKYYPMKLSMSLGPDKYLHNSDPWYHVEQLIGRYFDDLENGVHIWISFKLANDIGNIKEIKTPIIVDLGNVAEQRFYKRTIFYVIGQFSRYIIPHSRRIDVTVSGGRLRVIGFQRPDKMIALIVYNSAKKGNDCHANISDGEHKFSVEVPNKTIQTILYHNGN